jgi:preprotein translocase subunit YajC
MLTQLIQTAPAAPTGAASILQSPLIAMAFIFAIFYFLLIAPMRKKQKATAEMLSKLKKGDEVISSGGIFGRITAVDDERGFVVLQIADNVKIKVLRTGIVGPAGEPDTAAAAAPKT